MSKKKKIIESFANTLNFLISDLEEIKKEINLQEKVIDANKKVILLLPKAFQELTEKEYSIEKEIKKEFEEFRKELLKLISK